jgi:hypothetical protein
LGRQETALRLESGLCNLQIGACLIDGELVGHRVNLEEQGALGHVDVFLDRNVDDPAADFGRDMDDVGIDARVIGRRHDRAAVQGVDPEADRRRDDCQRDHHGPGDATTPACRPHRYCPNQSSHARRPQHRPIAEQTNNCNGSTLASPEVTKPMRTAIAKTMPISAQNIQPGK